MENVALRKGPDNGGGNDMKQKVQSRLRLFGFALQFLGGSRHPVYELIKKGSDILFLMINWIMKVAPIGAFGAMAFTIGKYGIHSLLPLGKLMLVFYATCLFFAFW